MADSALSKPVSFGRTAEIYPWEPGKVLKLYLRGWDPSIVEHEMRLTRLANESSYTAPAVYEQVEIDGRHGFVMEQLNGTMLTRYLMNKPWRAYHLGAQLGQLHAQMHTHLAAGLPPQKVRLNQKINAIEGAPPDILAAALEAVEHLPENDRLCHNDFHPENVLFDGQHFYVIDWMDATSGHPLGDVARTMILLQIGSPPGNVILNMLIGMLRKRFIAGYQSAYFAASPYTQTDLEPFFLPVGVARFSEDIRREQPRLLQFLKPYFPPGLKEKYRDFSI